MKNNHRTRLACIVLISSSAAIPLNADPVGGQVQAGHANITTGPGAVTINQLSDRVIINWNSFSIAPGEVTSFLQPSTTAAALNRVITDNPSLIYGTLQANGHVYLINQSGILVGPGGHVNTGGFTASTLDVNDSSFLSGGNMNFTGHSTAGVNNQGSIQALGGDVFLIANTVANSGSINAPQGTVGLAAGSSVQLLQAGSERISVVAGNSLSPQGSTGVNNVGAIDAVAAELKAAGGNIYALAINNGGVIRATSLVNENGHIMLKSDGGNINNSGTLSAHNADGSGGSVILDGGHNAANPSTVISTGLIEARGDATGAKGGQVEILGDHVGLMDNALVDVSGDAGGGMALIGGSFQGKDATIRNAEGTIVSPDATIKADALTTGDGGKVVVWSENVTHFYGLISAQGGSHSGNGGNVEVSSHGLLDFQGDVSTLAAHGKSGVLLLDPHDLVVTNGGNSGSTNGSGGFADGGATNDSVINDGKLNSLLGSGNVTLFANDDITISKDSSITSIANDLTLRAGRSITLDGDNTKGASIAIGGAFSATFNDSGATVAGRDPGAASFTMNGTGAGTASVRAVGGITIQGGTLAADSSGATSIDANTGSITLTSLSTVSALSGGADGGVLTIMNNASGAAGKNITVSAAGGLTSAGANGAAVAGGNGGAITLTADGTVTVNGAINSKGGNGGAGNNGGNAGAISLTGNQGITLHANVSALGGTGSTAGTDGAISLAAASGGVTQTAGGITGATLALSGNGTFNAGGSSNDVNSISGAVGGAVTYKDANALTVNALDAGSGDIAITSTTGNLTVGGAVTTTGNTTLTATAGNIANGGGSVGGNVVTLNANGANGSVAANTAATQLAATAHGNGTINVTDADALTVNSATTGSGDINITSTTGNLTVGGPVTTTGNAALVATAGSIAKSGSGKVSANQVTLTGGGANGAVDANTAATTIVATGNGNGTINIAEDDSVTVNTATTGSGDVNITTTTGNLTVGGAVTTTGNATLTATAGNIAQSGAGKVSANLVTLNAGAANGSINADTAATTLAATGHGSGAITIVEDDGATINSATTGSGTVNISSTTGDLTVSGPVTTTGNATLTATAGNIANGGGKVSGNLVTLTASGVNGSVNANTAATSLAVSGQGAGNVTVAEDDSVTVNTASSGTGIINITANTGNLTVGSVTTGGGIQLKASAGSVLNDGSTATSVQSTGGTTVIIAGGAGNNIGTAANPLDVTSTGGAVTLDARGGAVHVNLPSAGDVEFTASSDNGTFVGTSFTEGGQTFTADYTDLAGGNFTLNANGNILDSAGVNVLVPLSTLTLDSTLANGSIGTGLQSVHTTAGTLDLSANGTGIINVLESDGATISSATTGSGDIAIGSTTGNLTVAGPVSTSGNDTLITLNGNIAKSGGGKVSGNLVTLNANGSVDANTAATALAVSGQGSGTIAVVEDDSLTVNSATTGSGTINITATTGNVTVGGNIATSGNSTVTASAGNILNGGGKVGGNLVTLSANAANGSVNANTAANQLAVTGHGNGTITIAEDDSVQVTSATTGSGDISIATATGNLNIGGPITTTGNDTLTATAGSIVNGGGKVSGNLVTLNADGINGSVGANTAAANLAVTGQGAGTINVTEDDNVSVNSATTGSGNINIATTSGNLTVGGAVTTTGDTALQAGGANHQLTVNGSGSVTGQSGVQLTADQMTLQGAVNSGGARTTLASVTAGRNIDLGTKTAGELGLTGADLAEVTASVLQIGNGSAGAINVSGAISTPTAPVLALVNNSSITEGAGGSITSAGLRISSPGPVTLAQANQVNNLSAAVSGSGNGFTFNNAGVLFITAVDGVTGVTTVNGPIDVTTANGALTVAGNVNAGTSTATLSAGSSGNDNLLAIGPGTTVEGHGGVTLVGDNIAIDGTSSVDAGAARATLKQFENGTAINLGGADGPGTLGITETELSRITAGVYQIGDVNAGDITITGPISIDPGGVFPNPNAGSITGTRLNLVTGGNISEVGGSVTVPVLSLQAGGNINMTTPINDVNFLGSQSGTPIHFVDVNTLLPSPVALDGQTLPGVNPQPADVRGGGGGANISTLSVQLAGIAYVDIPVLKLSTASFTARVEGNAATLVPPGSITTLGLTVPFPDEEKHDDARRIEDRTKWVTGRMVVSGSTAAPQSSK